MPSRTRYHLPMLLLRIAETLLPIILLVALGAALFKASFLQPADRSILDRLVYWVCLPSLLVVKIAEAGTIDPSIGWVILAMALVTLAAAGLSAAAWYFLSREPATFGVMIQAGFRGNLAFVGLPVIKLAGADDRTLAIAALTLAPTIALYNLLAVPVLSAGTRHNASLDATAVHPAIDLLRSIVTNPFIIACLVGLAMGASPLTPPETLMTTLGLVGQPAAPLALISLGGALTIYRVRSHLALASVITTIKLAVCPALAVLLAWALNLDSQQAFALIMLAAVPTAVASYVLVTQIGGDEGLAASIIATTTLASVISLAAGLAVVHAWPA